MFEHMTTAERIEAAKEKTERVVDHLLYLLALHENNAIIVYSDTLSSQIPYSRAANAFNVFRAGLHQFEIVRLCALWDRAGDDKENIPTIIELIRPPEVIEALAQETLGHWSGIGGHIMNPSKDPALSALEAECLQRHNEEFGQQQAQRARDELRKAIADVRAILSSSRLSSIMNLRHKHLAHSLTETKLEKKAGRIPPMKYGDEREILLASLRIVEALHCWVSGKCFSFADSQEIGRNNAEALWKRCIFDIQRASRRSGHGRAVPRNSIRTEMIKFRLSLWVVGPARAAQMPEQFHGEWRTWEAPRLRSEEQTYFNCEPGPYCPEAAPEELFYITPARAHLPDHQSLPAPHRPGKRSAGVAGGR